MNISPGTHICRANSIVSGILLPIVAFVLSPVKEQWQIDISQSLTKIAFSTILNSWVLTWWVNVSDNTTSKTRFVVLAVTSTGTISAQGFIGKYSSFFTNKCQFSLREIQLRSINALLVYPRGQGGEVGYLSLRTCWKRLLWTLSRLLPQVAVAWLAE